MKADIHPDYVDTTVTCSCGRSFQTRSVRESLSVELCSECHPFFTGKQRLVDTGGRVERFRKRVDAKDPATEKKIAEKLAADRAKAKADAAKAKVTLPKPVKRQEKKEDEPAAKSSDVAVEAPAAEAPEAAAPEAATAAPVPDAVADNGGTASTEAATGTSGETGGEATPDEVPTGAEQEA
ncbi:MAG: 50S ribosomal protein L31 [Acidimicrobiia bacterium]|nr:50S ribosomal protein L31 [Acidimicrobiia bacterium]